MRMNTQLALRLPQDLWDLLTKKSIDEERTKSWLIREALRKQFKGNERKENK